MAISSAQSGTLNSVIDTNHPLGGSVVTPGTYVLVVDLSNLVAGDDVTLEVQTKPINGAAFTTAYKMDYSGVQVTPVSYSIPVPIDTAILCYLMQTNGSAKVYDWNLLNL